MFSLGLPIGYPEIGRMSSILIRISSNLFLLSVQRYVPT